MIIQAELTEEIGEQMKKCCKERGIIVSAFIMTWVSAGLAAYKSEDEQAQKNWEANRESEIARLDAISQTRPLTSEEVRLRGRLTAPDPNPPRSIGQ